MTQKKAQSIVLFIILGIILIVIFSSSLVIKETSKTPEPAKELDMNSVKTYVESCIDIIAEEAVFYTGMQGGYYDTPSPSKKYLYIDVPVYWDNQQSNVPSKEVMESEMFRFIKENLRICLNDFSLFKKQKFMVGTGELDGDAMITSDAVTFKILYPISVRRGDSIVQFDEFYSKVDVNVGKKIDLINKMMQQQQKTPDSIPLGFMTTFAEENNFIFETVMMDKATVFFSWIFIDETDTRGNPYILSFINRYEWADLNLSDGGEFQ